MSTEPQGPNPEYHRASHAIRVADDALTVGQLGELQQAVEPFTLALDGDGRLLTIETPDSDVSEFGCAYLRSQSVPHTLTVEWAWRP